MMKKQLLQIACCPDRRGGPEIWGTTTIDPPGTGGYILAGGGNGDISIFGT